MKILSYGNPTKFAAGISIEEATKRLRSRIHKMDIVTTLASSVPESKLAGEVSDNSVALNRVRPFFWNLFKPHFYGRFVKSGGRVALEGAFTVSVFAKVIFFAFLTILTISEIVFKIG